MKLLNKIKQNESFIKLLKTFQKRTSQAEIGNSSVVVTYYLLLSMFPLLIAVGNILPFLKIEPTTLLPYIKEVLPLNIYTLLKPTVSNLLENVDGGLLSISALATIWAGSKCMNALQSSLNKVYGVKNRKNAIITRLFSFVMVFFYLLSIILLVFIFGVGQVVLEYLAPILQISDKWVLSFTALKWPVTILILLFVMASIYFFIPNAKQHFLSIIPGTVFTTIGWMILSQGFGIYVKYFAKSVTSYGVIGSFMIFIIWLNLASTIIILGGVLNSVTEEFRNGEIHSKNEMAK